MWAFREVRKRYVVEQLGHGRLRAPRAAKHRVSTADRSFSESQRSGELPTPHVPTFLVQDSDAPSDLRPRKTARPQELCIRLLRQRLVSRVVRHTWNSDPQFSQLKLL
jgi:hypothetical protein